MLPVMTIACTILLVLVGMNMAIGYYQMSARDSIQLAVRIILVFLFAFSWSNFGTVYDAFATASGDMAMRFFDVAATTGDSSTYAAMDKFASQMADTADGVAKAQGSIMRGVLGALFFLALSLLMAIYVLIVGFAKIMLAFLIGIAPIAIVATIFERTKNMFEAWLSSFVGYLMYPIAASSVIATIVAVARQQFEPQDNVDTIDQTIGFLVVVIVGFFALKQIPSAASNITGHFHLANIAPQALRLGQGGLGVAAQNLPGTSTIRDAATIASAARAGTSDDPRKQALDRDRELRERGAAIRLKFDQMRLLRGGKD
ncbi:type IV secretion system protein [Paracoccus sp. M683]|uniref:type IV secretion system protein n=1 Tax=Paracoccus sp. M683 TaxID=2594268 RepID=UPI00163DD9CD|nr:type IV secretion system protein [Paracoccus sp. M683]